MALEIKPTFSKVGMAYARRFEELDAARSTFLEERRRILMELALVEEEALKQAGLKPSSCDYSKKQNKDKDPADDADCWDWYIDRSCTAAWNAGKSKKDRREDLSGVSLYLYSDEGIPFSFYSLLWFLDVENLLVDEDSVDDEDVVSASHEITRELVRRGIVTPQNLWVVGDQLWVVTSAIRPDAEGDFTYDRFREEALRLPRLFLEVDDYLAELVARRRGEDE